MQFNPVSIIFSATALILVASTAPVTTESLHLADKLSPTPVIFK